MEIMSGWYFYNTDFFFQTISHNVGNFHFYFIQKTDSLTGESYTFSQLDDLSRRVGSALYKRGLRRGDIVVFMEIDIVKQPLFLTGVWRANGICRASYPEDDENTLFERVKESRTGWIYCEPFHADLCLRVAERIYWDVEVIVTCTVDSAPPGCTSIYELFQDDGSGIDLLKLLIILDNFQSTLKVRSCF